MRVGLRVARCGLLMEMAGSGSVIGDRGLRRMFQFPSSGKQKHRREQNLTLTPERDNRSWDDNIKMDYNRMRGGYVAWVHLAQDIDEWRVVVCTVMELRIFHSKWETSWLAEKVRASETL